MNLGCEKLIFDQRLAQPRATSLQWWQTRVTWIHNFQSKERIENTLERSLGGRETKDLSRGVMTSLESLDLGLQAVDLFCDLCLKIIRSNWVVIADELLRNKQETVGVHGQRCLSEGG